MSNHGANTTRAHDSTLDREVASKVLSAEADPGRFLREARIAANIRSPHVVSVFDYHMLNDGRSVIVMELVNGRSLADVIRSSRELSIDDLSRYAMSFLISRLLYGAHTVDCADVVLYDQSQWMTCQSSCRRC
jgi:serine/threonine protein kinase